MTADKYSDERVVLQKHPCIDGVDMELGEVWFCLDFIVVEIREHEAECVADLAVVVSREFEELFVDFDIVFVRERADPPAEDIDSIAVEEVFERGACGFGEFFAVFVDHEAVGEKGAEWWASHDSECWEEGELEPSSVLVGAFEVELDWEVFAT